MLYQLLLIHLYRPFLKYTKSTSPLPQHVSPRKLCSQAAAAISKLLRLYKRTYGFKQICNIAVYIAHTALTIHLLNIPEKSAQRDVIYGLRHLEEMGESWLCARRTLRILDISANKWQVQLPREAVVVFEQTHARWGSWGHWDQAASPSTSSESLPVGNVQPPRVAINNLPSAAAYTASHQPANISIHSSPLSAGPTASQIPSAPPAPLSVSALRAAQRSFGAQLAQTEARQPEPTYLRPVANSYGSAPSGQLPPQEQWYDPDEAQLRTFTAAQSGQSPLTAFDASENLVEESQDWWSRDVKSLELDDEWTQGWNNNVPATSSIWRYENNIPHMSSASALNPGFKPPQPARILATMPPHVPPSQNLNAPGENGFIFPENYQR